MALMTCDCGAVSTVVDSRVRKGAVTRRRKCQKCGARWSTEEATVGSTRKGAKHMGGGEKPVSAEAHVVVKVLFARKERLGVSWEQLAKVSGMSIATMQDWKRRTWPTLWAIDAALGAVGLEITTRKKQ